MSTDAFTDSTSGFCVLGLIYFEVFVPGGDLDVEPGREHFVDHIDVGLGGALNVATVASALGVDTTIAHPRGEGLTDAAIDAAIDGLGLHPIQWPARSNPAISLVHSTAGDRSFMSSADYEALAQAPPLPGFDWIHVPGLEEAHRLEGVLRRARDGGTTISVSGSWAPDRLDALGECSEPVCDLLILNADEARRAADGCDGDSPAEVLTALRGAAEDVIITDGPRAIHAHLGGQSHVVDVPPAETFVDATGAGDAFGAGFIAARLSDISPDEALRFAAHVASAVVGIRGGVVDRPDVFDHLDMPNTANFATSTEPEP